MTKQRLSLRVAGSFLGNFGWSAWLTGLTLSQLTVLVLVGDLDRISLGDGGCDFSSFRSSVWLAQHVVVSTHHLSSCPQP